MRSLVFLGLLVMACLAGAVFGALHDQVSYTVGPEYFTVLKFQQFQIDPGLPIRLGVALVGILASWWMGLVIGLPVFGLGLFIPNRRTYWRAGVTAIMIAMGTAAMAAIFGLGLAYATVTPDRAATWAEIFPLTEPVRFGRVALMHNASYLGGGVGLIIALIFMGLTVQRARKNDGGR
ncbi:hypothetical protein [Actibacterium sp. 188UL27-1]|uniref:hypothetical protein n=1 Tax=Actibacterium sp. 188UL27-1 TaxID=2786961 RepID=UPI001957F1DB|nr:hypothetical protein [Actibacterium sp. 188UL27-1]MBM7066389.1 hypothetical protein [Actibacterium sp. 188UL27-1]